MSDNELIAEFMGLKRHHKEIHLFWIPINDSWNSKEHLQYHREWGWLMDVVDRIERIENVMYVTITTKNSYVTIDLGPGYPDGLSMMYGYGDSKIERVYRTVVEFIKWHNGNR